MFGSIVKTYTAQKLGVDAAEMFSVSGHAVYSQKNMNAVDRR